MKSQRIRILSFLTGAMITLLGTVPASHAALISNFTDLRTELSDRLGVLSNSVDKTEQKLAKACTKGIVIIDKSLTLAGDIKASAKLAKLLQKTFPDEFAPTIVGGLVFSNNVRTLLVNGYFSIADQLDIILQDLQLSIDSLPESKDRDQAQAALNDAANALEAAFGDTTWSEASKLLGACLKSAAKAQKIIDKIELN
ncbi:MAG: hypothetical protein PCFJNLEI_03746 [Verrucomicrobiae bacterium]|nr:hypothetical protein [Verrucomicrobiae bacterium]